MASQHPDTPQGSPPSQQRAIKALHNTALVTLFLFPAITLLPPRKLDFLTFGLIGGTYFSANWLHRERYGRSILERITGTGPRQVAVTSPGLFDSAQSNVVVKQKIGDHAQLVQEKAWVTERRVEEKEAIEEGKGIFDMMGDQVKQVFVSSKDSER